MTLLEFIQLLNDRYTRGTLYDLNGHVEVDIIEKFKANSASLKEEFFSVTEENLGKEKIEDARKYLGLLTVFPFEFEETDNVRFQKLVTKSIEKLANQDPTADISELADFVWVLLDHMLHNWAMSDEKAMIDVLKKFKPRLQQFESKHKGEVDLLYQKLGHFGVE